MTGHVRASLLARMARAHTRDDGDNGRPVIPRHAEAAERQQRIDEIKGLLAAAGFVPKDMFLTQPPAPDK